MALCEGQLDSALPQIKTEEVDLGTDTLPRSPEKKPLMVGHPNVFSPGAAGPLGMAVDYRSPRAHFLPPEIEMYAQAAGAPPAPLSPASTTSHNTVDSSSSGVPAKRKRGRPRIDKSSREYLANLAARKQAKEMAAVMNSSGELIEKRKRGRPRVDKTSPEYMARKRAREIEALEKKAKRQYKRRTTAARTKVPSKLTRVTKASSRVTKVTARATKVATRVTKAPSRVTKVTTRVAKVVKGTRNGRKVAGQERKVVIRRTTKFVLCARKKDSGASSSTGDTTPRVKRKYTRRAPCAGAAPGAGQSEPEQRGRNKKVLLGPDGQPVQQAERPRGKRGRRRKSELIAAGLLPPAPPPPPSLPKKRGRPKLDRTLEMRGSLVPINAEPISLDSDDEPDLGSQGAPADSLGLDENMRALRHLHEKYANIGEEDAYQAHLLAARRRASPALSVESVKSSPGRRPEPSSGPKVEKLEDSSDSASSSSGSGSSSSGSGSSSSGSSSSSDSSDSEPEAVRQENGERQTEGGPLANREDDRSLGAWSHTRSGGSLSDSGSEAPAPGGGGGGGAGADADEPHQSLSESENESPDKSFQCNVCHKWYSTNVTLKIHKRSHLSRGSGASRWRRRAAERYECDCCQQTFSCRENLLEHKAEAHRGSMTVRCDVCRRCFEDDHELAAHLTSHTADERASRCGECGAQFARWEQLRRHRACAHPPPDPAPRRHPHACHQCGKAFGHAHSLTRHLANHSKAVYRCVVCKSSFERADQLAQHLNSHLATYRRLKP